MKKILLKILTLCVVLCSALFVFSACNGEIGGNDNDNTTIPPTHTCEYNKQLITDLYKKSDATCKKKAVYYYSCECGEKGTEVFEHGDVVDHVFENNECKWCDKSPSVGLEYCLINGNNEYEVAGIGSCRDKQLIIPATYNDLPVTSIGDWAFVECASLTKIELPNSITKIGLYAFTYCESLQSIRIPKNVMSIGACAFSYCFELANIIVDSNNSEYESVDGNLYSKDETVLIQYSIAKTETSFTVPDSVTIIDYGAFCCSSLVSIQIPDEVIKINNGAFSDCTSLTSIVIPNYTKFIGVSAFENCRSLTIYCEAESKPDGWDSYWNPNDRPVVWGYKG